MSRAYSTILANEGGLLKKYNGADVGYSLRDISGISSNLVVKVRRSSDDAESDFTSNEVKNGTLLNYVVPTTLQARYNNGAYFDGIDDHFRDTSGLVLSDGDYWEWTQYKMNDGNAAFASLSSNTRSWLTNTGMLLRLNGGTTTDITTGENLNNAVHEMKLERSGTEYTLSVDGVDKVTVDMGDTTTLIGVSFLSLFSSDISFKGSIWNFRRNGVVVANGNGVDASTNWAGWTKNGSPAVYTGQGLNGYVTKWYDQSVDRRKARLYFDGDDDYISIGSRPVDTNDITILAWVNNTKSSGDSEIISSDTAGGQYLRIRDNEFFPYIADSNSNTVFSDTGTIMSSDQIKLIAVSIDYDGNIIFNVDGSQVDIKPSPFTGTLPSIASIGRQNSDYFGGDIFQIALVDKALSNAEMLIIYNDGHQTPIQHENLANLWINTGNSNADWEDEIGSNDGTVNGSPENLYKAVKEDIYRLAKDATQNSATIQPRIVSNGTLITENSMPAIRFYKSIGTKLINETGINSQPISVFGVANFYSDNSFLLDSDSTNDFSIYRSDSANEIRLYSETNGIVNNTVALNNQFIVYALGNTTNSELGINGNPVATGAIGGGVLNNILIGGKTLEMDGTISELIIYNSNKSSERNEIENNINNYYGVY